MKQTNNDSVPKGWGEDQIKISCMEVTVKGFKIARPMVIIFGAGATRGGMQDLNCVPPIDIDFFDIANQIKGHGTQSLVKDVLKSVWELYGRTTGVSLEKYYRDIETRAMISRFAKPANQPKDWRKRQHDLEELIRRIYIHTTCESSANGSMKPNKSKIHSYILKNILQRKDIILTFNYDLVIEESFESSSLWNPVDGYGVRIRGKKFDWCRQWMEKRQLEAKKQSTVTLLKLHGSLNWLLYNNRTIKLKERPYGMQTKYRRPRIEKISILPPGWNKRIDRNPYKLFWKEARLQLEKCKTLVILGYSLPETDLLAQALFSEVVRHRCATKKYLKELHLADPIQEVKERLISLFIPALGPAGKVFVYKGIEDFATRYGMQPPAKKVAISEQ